MTATTEIAKRSSTVPVVSPAVVRSLYRSLFREVRRLDRDPVAKVLFPCNKELQALLGAPGPLHVPGGRPYTDTLREVFRDAARAPKINLAFDTLTRLRAHHGNVESKLPTMDRDRARLLASLRSPGAAERRKSLFRAAPATAAPGADPKYVQAAPGVPTRVVLREARHRVDLSEGTLLLAHPLSSAHVDRRVMLVTESTPVMTSAVVLDLQFTYPLSRGNPMFPEVFWGHDVYEGGLSQIGFTMPPTAQIAVLHTLEPKEAAVGGAGSASPASSSVMGWLKWKDGPSRAGRGGAAPTSAPAAVSSDAAKRHSVFCHPLIPGGVLDDGTREPTLYMSKSEALPYLAGLVEGQPRSSLRLYWGSMRWTTSQLEAEVVSGHWMAVKASPSFFRAYALSAHNDDAAEHFSTAAQLREARELRERRYGADVAPPQVFPPDQIMRRRECLWDEIMFALGGDYAALVGCTNPFSDGPRWSSVQILAPHVSPLPLTADGDEAAAPAEAEVAEVVDTTPAAEVVLGEDGENDKDADDDEVADDEVRASSATGILEHSLDDVEEPSEEAAAASLSQSPPASAAKHSPANTERGHKNSDGTA